MISSNHPIAIYALKPLSMEMSGMMDKRGSSQSQVRTMSGRPIAAAFQIVRFNMWPRGDAVSSNARIKETQGTHMNARPNTRHLL